MLPKFYVPKVTEVIVDEKGFQKQWLFKFFDQLSRGSWKKSYPDTDGTITYYTITSNPALVSLILSSITAYQRDDQTWLVDVNTCHTVASGSRTGCTLSISGLKFKNTTGLFQPVNGFAMDGAAPYPIRCYAQLNTGNIILTHASATTTIYGFRATGLILEEQPGFAE